MGRSCSITFHLVLLKQGLWLNLELAWRPELLLVIGMRGHTQLSHMDSVTQQMLFPPNHLQTVPSCHSYLCPGSLLIPGVSF